MTLPSTSRTETVRLNGVPGVGEAVEGSNARTRALAGPAARKSTWKLAIPQVSVVGVITTGPPGQAKWVEGPAVVEVNIPNLMGAPDELKSGLAGAPLAPLMRAKLSIDRLPDWCRQD